MRENELTAKEREVVDYISNAIQTDGFAPSVRDIQLAVGFRSTSTVQTYLSRLEEKGFIRREQGKSRSLRLEDDSRNSYPGSRESGSNDMIKVPMLGRVAAGLPILAMENLEGYLDFPASAMSRMPVGTELFALRVAGDSMIGDGIFDRDIVIVRKDSHAADGDMVVALVEEEATVKRLFKENGRYRLQPSNPAMQPIYADTVFVLGHIVAVIRLYSNG